VSAELPRRLGPYVLLAPLAHSDAATTYLARSTAEARLTAAPLVVKVHHPALDPAALARAHRRMTVISRFVPRTLEVGLADEGSYVVLEHVAGWSLAAALEAEPARWPVSSAARLLYGVAQALAKLGALADTDRVHGHVSPHTVLLGLDGRPHLIGLDRPGGAGVLGYAAPEQLTQAPLDPRADLYALGALAWRLLSGRPWIAPGSPAAMRRATLEAEPTSLTADAPEVPRRLDALVQALLAPEATSRFDSAESVAEALLALVPEADSPEPDVSERVGEALWSTRESTRTLVARASESMVEFHRPGEAFEGWSASAATPAEVLVLEPTAEGAGRHTPIGARRVDEGAGAPRAPALVAPTFPGTWGTRDERPPESAEAPAAAGPSPATPSPATAGPSHTTPRPAQTTPSRPSHTTPRPTHTTPRPPDTTPSRAAHAQHPRSPDPPLARASDPQLARASGPSRSSDPQLARTSHPSLGPAPPPPAVRWAPAVAAATLAGAVLATMVVTLSNPPSDVVVLPLPDVVRDGGAAAVVAVRSSSLAALVARSSTAVDTSPTPSPPGETPAPTPAASWRPPSSERPRPSVPRPSPTARTSPIPSPDVVVAEISRLLARARLARARSADAARSAELDRIIGGLVLEASATEAPGLAERLRAHDARLTALELAPR
jgi:hypothetical protein